MTDANSIMKALSALESEQSPIQFAKLVERLDKACKAHGMEISAEKTKLMTNNTRSIDTEI